MSPCGRVRLCIRSFVVAVVSKPVHDLSLRLSSPLLPFLRAILINLNSIEFNGRLVKPSRVQCIRSYTPWIYFSFSPSSLSPPPPIFVDNYYVYAREREREREMGEILSTNYDSLLYYFDLNLCRVFSLFRDPRALTLQYFHYCYATDQTGERIFDLSNGSKSGKERGRGWLVAFDSTALNKSPPLSPAERRCIDN